MRRTPPGVGGCGGGGDDGGVEQNPNLAQIQSKIFLSDDANNNNDNLFACVNKWIKTFGLLHIWTKNWFLFDAGTVAAAMLVGDRRRCGCHDENDVVDRRLGWWSGFAFQAWFLWYDRRCG
jgi:hypothetical protein